MGSQRLSQLRAALLSRENDVAAVGGDREIRGGHARELDGDHERIVVFDDVRDRDPVAALLRPGVQVEQVVEQAVDLALDAADFREGTDAGHAVNPPGEHDVPKAVPI